MSESTFESQYEELEKLVERLEGGKLPVDESMKLFRRGVDLVTALKKELQKLENEVIEIKGHLETQAHDE